jgi:phage shock protein PspC (stress-responsive transcriptional regulator)
MKKVININFQGRVVPIEETAYDILKQYVEALRRFFANEEGKEEIINDIESRIAELFAEVLKKGSTCITDIDVNNIITSMGRPEDFEGEEEHVKTQLGGEQKQQNSYQQQVNQQQFTGEPRRLFRDENHKVLGGVCSGIANYFSIDRIIIRILAIVTFGFVFIPYLIVWIAVPSSATKVIGSTRKRLFRDMDDKILAGVASGLGNYFGVNAWIPRVIFLIPFLSFVTRWSNWGMFDFPHFLSLSFSPGATIIYIILWLILPEAITSADKLEMKGQPVDLNSIKNTIQTDMEGFKGRAEKFGEELKDKAQEFGKEFGPKAQQFSTEAAYAARRSSRGLGDIIALLAKIFAYFILGVVLFTIVGTLFGIGVACLGLLPIKDFIIYDGWQNVFAWGTLVLFIWIPVIGIITWIIRKLIKAKRNSFILRGGFIALWVVGWACLMSLIASVIKDFKYTNTPVEDNITLSNAKVAKLEVRLSGYDSKYYKNHNRWLEIEPFAGFTDDTAYVPNTRIRVVKSKTDSFQVTVLKMSDGNSKTQANELAEKVTYNIAQTDSVLALYKGITINKTDKFRNQRIIITIAVPVGKRIVIDDKIGWKNHVHFGFNNDWNDRWSRNFYNDDEEQDWEAGKEYIQTAKGLERVGSDKYSYDSEDNISNPEQLKQELEEQQRVLDEKKKELNRNIEEKLKQIDEDKRKLEKTIDSTKSYRYQKTVTNTKPETINKQMLVELNDEDLMPSILSSYKIAG